MEDDNDEFAQVVSEFDVASLAAAHGMMLMRLAATPLMPRSLNHDT